MTTALVAVAAAGLVAAIAIPAGAGTLFGRSDDQAMTEVTTATPAADETSNESTETLPPSADEAAGDTTGGSPAAAGGAATVEAADPTEASAGVTPAAADAAAVTPMATTASGACARTASSSPKVRIKNINVGVAVAGYGGEGDTAPLPMAITPRPGGSWLAFLGASGRIYLVKLNCADQKIGKMKSFAGVDLQDIKADKNGGVLLLTRKGKCGPNTLCGGSPSPCYKMIMLRFDTSGKKVWQVQVTNLTDSRKGYTNGARFVWWYQHHGRLERDNKGNYAAYFGVAITVQNGNCVDIHEGDRMQVVNKKGKLIAHQDSFEVGCSHSWGTRMVWDGRTGHFVMVCATDNNCRIAQPNPYRTVVSGACDGTLFGGDLVKSTAGGYWTAWSQGGTARLARFTTGAANKQVTTSAKTSHPHLVRYAKGRMLLTWESGSTMVGQLYTAKAATKIGGQFKINVTDHDFLAFKQDTADGSAVYPAAGSSSTSIKIARVMPLS